MYNHAPAEYVHITHTHVQVPEEVAKSTALEETSESGISPDPQVPVFIVSPGFPFFVVKDDIQTEGIYKAALNKADDVNVPANPLSPAELGVSVGKETRRECRRNNFSQEGVQANGEEDLMCMER